MNKVAIIICNYNKQEYLMKCLQSVLQSKDVKCDIYVIDNASTDNSVEIINREYKNKVELIVNEKNKGGSGGFNTGIKKALRKDYKYLMLLDNDVILEKNAIKASFDYLEKNEDIAVVGSKIYSMDNPNQIQELGANVDFENYSITPFYKGYKDVEKIPEVVECHYVPACAMMIRVSAIKKVGLMAEENFIYWDDIEWGYRFISNGYRVVAYSKSIVWHKMGVGQKINTFGTYYFWRNRVRFFIKYIEKEEIERFITKISDEVFQAIFMCNYLGKYNSAKAICYALEDALNNITGKAQEDRIMLLEEQQDRFAAILNNKSSILIFNNSDISTLRNLVNKIKEYNIKITIYDKYKKLSIGNQFDNVEIINDKEKVLLNNYDLICNTCYHILDIGANYEQINKNGIYVDRYLNVAHGSEDISNILNYDLNYNLLKNIWFPILLNKAYKLKNDESFGRMINEI
ncbi:glycosyltransferase family 2 protein [Clostridium beijerinckii]|uniref:Chondroitin synthase n=1 Tax=Clostridium beijerinckii TaxID=1520 RepID=A0A1S8S5X2_CLOBE|nr:glycosyltransferase family 2 protein [Clostridium beijerinckii]NRY60050.1 hypothetical protein [Clostridium beijerinckii]OOM60906.1 chondroitin synthase [Clostridium beijerinckii]